MKGSVAWFTTLPAKGSGGFRTILQNARALERQGYTSDFYFLPDEAHFGDEEQVRTQLNDWYGYTPHRIFPAATKLVKDYDLAIATTWNSASYVADQDCEHKAYFIQDFEPQFFPMGTEYLEALASYHLGLAPITIGRWLAMKCRELSSANAYVTDFSADLSVYRPLGVKRQYAICAIYQPEKPRRASGILIEALAIVQEILPDLAIYLFGADQTIPDCPALTSLGILSVQQCNELYNSCMLGISMSTSNPSRIPFEMMAAGLPVVDLSLPNNYYDLPEEAVQLAEPNAASLASAVIELLASPSRRARMAEAGATFMTGRDISLEGEQFAAACINIIKNESAADKDYRPINRRQIAGPQNRTLELALTNRQNRREGLRRRIAPFTCLGNKVSITLDGLPDNVKDVRLACWSDPLQKDIVWETLANLGSGWNCRVKLQTVPVKPTLYHFHFYTLTDAADTSKLTCSFDKALQCFDGCHNTEKRVSGDDCNIALFCEGAPVSCRIENDFSAKEAMNVAVPADDYPASPSAGTAQSHRNKLFSRLFAGRRH